VKATVSAASNTKKRILKFVKANRRKTIGLAVAVVVGLTGLVALQLSGAATYVISLEAESGNLSGNQSKLSNSSASGSQAVRFGGGTTPTPTPTPPTPTPPTPPGNYKPNFVYREGKNMMLNGGVYKFVGYNDFSLTGCRDGSSDQAQLDRFFSGLRPKSLTRTWAFQSSNRGNIDAVVKTAEKYNQKVMLVLGEGAGYCGASINGPGFFAGGYTGAYFSWIRTIVPQYKDSPAVVWEIMNEPGQNGGGGTQAQMKKFYHDSAQLIKSLAPNHLVSVGTLDSYQSWQSGQAGYADVHNSPYIDLVSMHEYEYDYSGNTGTASRFGQNKAAADSLNKPIFVGEFGTTRGCTDVNTRSNVAKQKYDAYLSAGAAGALYWATGEPGETGTICGVSVVDAYSTPVFSMTRNYSHPNLPTPK
jgi:mannan endo-1,4-beta-mannosidase